MTCFYTPADEKYLEQKQQNAAGLGNALGCQLAEAPPFEEIPDTEEAERMWKLLCLAAESS